MLINKESHQRETFTEWPIRLALTSLNVGGRVGVCVGEGCGGVWVCVWVGVGCVCVCLQVLSCHNAYIMFSQNSFEIRPFLGMIHEQQM